MPPTYCESCLMPFSQDPGTRETPQFCSLCYQNGKLCYSGDDLAEFQTVCYQSMLRRGMNPIAAYFFSFYIRFAPRWKKQRWQTDFLVRLAAVGIAGFLAITAAVVRSRP